MTQRYTQADLDALNEAIALGAKRVSYNGQTVEYRDIDHMRAIRDEMERDLGISKSRRRSRATFRSGL